MTTAKPSIFISYSRHDVEWMERLVQRLRLYELEELLTVWEDRQIRAGRDWLPEIQSAIQQARMAVLLVSNDFLVSKFIREEEMPLILERRKREGLVVVPVLVKECNWQDVPWLSGIQACPPGKPLSGLRGHHQEAALATIAREIRELLQVEALPPPTLARTPLSEIPLAIHQLPLPPDDFIGRTADLKALKAAAQEGKTTAIFGMHGLGGVGKTTLALKLAHEIRTLYPDGQIFLDLLGVTTPLSVTDAMAHVIRSFHPGYQLPASETELAALYRSVLHGKRVLLLMDNAAGKDQVKPLLPPEGSSLLVTSRCRFVLPGLVETGLNGLPRHQSREFLLKIAPQIGELAEDLAQVCGDFPLALRVAASTLKEKRVLSVETYLHRLSTGRERLEPFDKALSLSYELLPKDLRCRWRQLAVFPNTFSHEAAAAVWDTDIEGAELILAELERNSLLDWNETSRRSRLHDLVRSFVEERLEQTEQRAAQERHARHYLAVLQSANSLYLKDNGKLLSGLRIFDTEWRNIQSGQMYANAEATQSTEGARLCSEYPNAAGHFLHLRNIKEWISWLEAALTAAKHLADRAAEGTHLGNLGLAYWALGEPHRAIAFQEQNVAIAREIGDVSAQGAALGNLGLSYAYLGEHRRAITFFNQHLAVARQLGERREEGNAIGNLGLSYLHLGEPNRAIELHLQELAIAREIGNLQREGNALGNLGLAHAALGKLRQAIDLYEEQLAITREIGDRQAEGNALCNLGSAYLAIEERHRAIECYEQHLAISRDIGDRRGEALSSWNLGLIYQQENPAQAVKFMQVCVDFERAIGHRDAEMDAAYMEKVRARIGR